MRSFLFSFFCSLGVLAGALGLALPSQAQNYQVAQNEEDLFEEDFFEDDGEDFNFEEENSFDPDASDLGEDEFSFEEDPGDDFLQEAQEVDSNESSMDSDISQMNSPKSKKVRPKESDRFYYIKHPNQKKGLYKISSDGKYYYKYDESDRKYGVAIKGGAFVFNDLINPRTGVAFKDVYGPSAKPGVFVEYLWPFFKDKDVAPLIRAMRLVLGAGFLYANGTGQFTDPIYSDTVAPESYNFFAFPLELGLQYAFEFYDKQLLVPYVGGAFNYLVGFEVQDGEFAETKLLGQLGAHFSAGGALSLNWLEESASFELDKEFGINQTYLTVEFRQNIGIQQDFDFTASSLTAGLWLEF